MRTMQRVRRLDVPTPALRPSMRMAAVLILALGPSSTKAQEYERHAFNVVIPGINDAPGRDWVRNIATLSPTGKRFIIRSPRRENWPIGRLVGWGNFLDGDDEIDAEVIEIDDPLSAKGRHLIDSIAALENATVFIDMDIGIEIDVDVLTPEDRSVWEAQTEWAGDVAAMLANERRKKFPDSPTELWGHSAGTQAMVRALNWEPMSEHPELFTRSVAMSPMDPDGLPKKTEIVISDRDLPSVARGELTARIILDEIMNSGIPWSERADNLARTLARRGHRVVRVVTEERGLSVRGHAMPISVPLNRLMAHRRTADINYPDQRMVVYEPDGSPPVEIRGSLANVLNHSPAASARARPIKSPGGVALRSTLVAPDELDAVVRISSEGHTLFLETDAGRYVVENVDARDFAALWRSVVLWGAAPVLTIGTQPSGMTGHARVSYYGGIYENQVGRDLLQADLKFKGIFLGIGAGPGGRAVDAVDRLFAEFPGLAAGSVRFWIVGSSVKVAVRSGSPPRVVLDDPGLRLMSESTQRGYPVEDEEMTRFTDMLSEEWTILRTHLPEFRLLEQHALSVALATWSQDRGIELSADLWLLPPRAAETPSHIPLAAVTDRGGAVQVAGGVSILRTERFGLGRDVVLQITGAWSRSTGWWKLLSVVIAGLIGLGLLLGPAALLRNRVKRCGGRAARLAPAVVAWALMLIAIHIMLVVASPTVLASLADFDREFMTVVITFMMPLLLVRPTVRHVIGKKAAFQLARQRSVVLTATLSLGTAITLYFNSTMAGVAVAVLSPRQWIDDVASWAYVVAAAPADNLSDLVRTYDRSYPGYRPGRRSLVRAQYHPFVLSPSTTQGSPTAATISSTGHKIDPRMPWTVLRRIRWPAGPGRRADRQYYSLTGQPPY